MQTTNYDKQKVINFIKSRAKNDPKRKGMKITTPNDDNVHTDIKAMSITNDVDGTVFSASFHEAPKKFYSFILPEEMYDKFEHFKCNYKYKRTPKKTTIKEDDFDGLFSEEKGIKELLSEVDT